MFHELLEAYYYGLPTAARYVVRGLLFGLAAWLVVSVVRVGVMGRIRSWRRIDATLGTFLYNSFVAAGWVVIIVAALLGFGVPGTTLGGLLAVGGFVVGFALKDTLGNLAAGVVLLLNAPYRIGEGVQVKGHDGTVTNLGIAMTTIKTWDGRMVTVPNGAVLGDAILNHTRNPIRRAEIAAGVSYEDDIDTAIRTAMGVLDAHPEVLKDPAPQVLVLGMGESSIDLSVRGWVNTADFVRVWADLNHKVKVALEGAGLSIPFPQRDIHIIPSGNGNGRGAGGGGADLGAAAGGGT